MVVVVYRLPDLKRVGEDDVLGFGFGGKMLNNKTENILNNTNPESCCSDARRRMPITPTPSSSGLHVSKYGHKSRSKV
ncbi:hypothetical protein Hdeb2414_s0012g00378841 [Helianthus debilis subsp. tardiflorus]